jgi:hypothetical protein
MIALPHVRGVDAEIDPVLALNGRDLDLEVEF